MAIGVVGATTTRPVSVLHVGIVGDYPGGMAQVVDEIMTWDVPGFAQQGVASTTGRHDILSPLRAVRVAYRIIRVSRQGAPAVCVVHLSERGSFLREGGLLMLCSLLRVPVVAHLHGADFVEFESRSPSWVRAVLRRASQIIALTDESARVAQAAAGDAVRVHVVHNAVRIRPLPQERHQQFLFCGEVGTRKGFDTLLAAWSLVGEALPGWKLVIAGPLTPEFSGLESRLPHNMEYRGVLPHDVAIAVQARSVAVVLPSRAEALPMALIEAMSVGCIPVSTPVGQIPELLEGGAGLLVGVNDSIALAEAMISIGRNVGLRSQLSQGARRRIVAEYSDEVIAEQLAAVWRAALTKPGRV
jgi:glycosyltransferase involved in cell wall biosynthesis